MNHRSLLRGTLILIVLILTVGCHATVPKEVVELSYILGQDLEAVHLSYKDLIHGHFDDIRSRATSFLDDQWTPNYLKDYIKKSDLIKIAQNIHQEEALEDVSTWTEVVVEQIENKRKDLLGPIDEAEAELLKSVDDAFSKLTRANAAITAHLNSIRQIQEVQDETLKALKLDNLKEKIDGQLKRASENAEKAIQDLQNSGENKSLVKGDLN